MCLTGLLLKTKIKCASSTFSFECEEDVSHSYYIWQGVL